MTMTYIVFEAALVGIFAFFCEDLINTVFSVHIPRLILAFAMLMTTGVLSYFDISLTSRVLGLCTVLEILILTAVAVAVLIHGGGPQGFVPESINPLNAFTPAKGVVGASAGIGLFFAFWSWVGFESSAMYGEESKNPKRSFPGYPAGRDWYRRVLRVHFVDGDCRNGTGAGYCPCAGS